MSWLTFVGEIIIFHWEKNYSPEFSCFDNRIPKSVNLCFPVMICYQDQHCTLQKTEEQKSCGFLVATSDEISWHGSVTI